MDEVVEFTKLATALADYAPRQLVIGGVGRLHLTIAAHHGLEVRRMAGDYYRIDIVSMGVNDTVSILLAIVYGRHLVVPVVREYARVHELVEKEGN